MTVNAIAGFAVPIVVGIWSDRRGRRLPVHRGRRGPDRGRPRGRGARQRHLVRRARARRGARLHGAQRAHHRAPGDRGRGRRGPAPPGRHQRPGDRGPGRRRGGGGHRRRADRAGARGGVRARGRARAHRPCRPSSSPAGCGSASAAPETGEETARPRSSARSAAPGRARGSRGADALGLRLRRAAAVLRALRRAQPRSRRRRGGRAAARLRPVTALGIVLAGRAPPERVHGLLVAGAALLGAGLLAAPATSLAGGGAPFAAAASAPGS